MVTSDRVVGRPRTECAVSSILAEPAAVELNNQTATVPKRMLNGTCKSGGRDRANRVSKPSAKTILSNLMGKSNYEAGG